MASINTINASLKNYSVTAQDLDNWLIYSDSNGQLVGWITETALKTFEVCKLNNADGNRFSAMRGYDAYANYQQALYFVLGAN